MSLSTRMIVALDAVAKIAAYEWNEEQKDIVDPEEHETVAELVLSDWIDEGYEVLDDISMYLDRAIQKRLR